MANNHKIENDAVEANIKINQQLEDGKGHAPIQANSEAEKANLEIQNQFGEDNNPRTLRASPAEIVTPR